MLRKVGERKKEKPKDVGTIGCVATSVNGDIYFKTSANPFYDSMQKSGGGLELLPPPKWKKGLLSVGNWRKRHTHFRDHVNNSRSAAFSRRFRHVHRLLAATRAIKKTHIGH